MKTLNIRFFVQGKDENRTEDFDVSIPGRLIIGRRKSESYPSLALDHDNAVDREHAMIVIDQEGRVLIEDLISTNGTFVQGYRIEELLLENGSQIKIGMTLVEVEFSVNSSNTNESQTVKVSLSKCKSSEQNSSESLLDLNQHLLNETGNVGESMNLVSGIHFNEPYGQRTPSYQSYHKPEWKLNWSEKFEETKDSLIIGYVFAVFFGAFGLFPVIFSNELTFLLGNALCSNSFELIREFEATFYVCNGLKIFQMLPSILLVLILSFVWTIIWLLSFSLKSSEGLDCFLSGILKISILSGPVLMVIVVGSIVYFG